MRICHIITTISKGGAENQLTLLARAQQELGHEVTIIPLKGPLDLAEDFSAVKVSVNTSLHGKNFIAQLFRLRAQVSNNFDLIHAHLPQAEFLTLIVRNKPIVITRHFGGNFYPGRNPVFSRMLSRVASSNATRVIAISKGVKDHLINNSEICKPEIIFTVPYGFDAALFTENISKNNLSNRKIANSKKFGTLARLSFEKDLPTLINAFKIYIQEPAHRSDILEIYGDGNLKKSLANLISQENLGEKIHLMGRTMDAASTMETFDVFVLTSKFEGFGMVFLEAMALGKPIICSRIPAALEVLGDEGAAIFFETGNPFDLADKMSNIQSYLSPVFKNLQRDRLREYGKDNMLVEIERVYNSATEARSKAHFSKSKR